MNHLLMSLLISFAPMVVVALTALMVMINIAIKRSHFWSATISVVGLNVALAALLLQIFGFWHVDYSDISMFAMDNFAKVNIAVILVASLACCTLAYGYFHTLKDNKDELYLLMLIATLGAMLMTSATHLAAFFMSLELLSVPMYGMLAYTFLRTRSLEAGLKYLIQSAAMSATLLMGMAFIFADVGGLEFSKIISVLFSRHEMSSLFVLGAVMMLVATAFKLSAAPFHHWVSDVYEGAPAPITAFLASVSKVAMMALLVRFLLLTASWGLSPVLTVLLVMTVLSILFGNLSAIRQSNLKRLLAYSSVAHIGYVLSVLFGLGVDGAGIMTVYMAVYALTSIGAFGVITLMSSPYRQFTKNSSSGEADQMQFYQGLFWRRPALTAVLTIMLLSMAGIPLTAGFITKFQVIFATIQGKQFLLAGMVILGSGLGLYYYLKFLTCLFQKPIANFEFDADKHWGVQAGGVMLLIITAIIVVLGIFPNGLLQIAQFIARG